MFMRIHRRYIIHPDFVDAFIGNMPLIKKLQFSISQDCQYSCFVAFSTKNRCFLCFFVAFRYFNERQQEFFLNRFF